MPNRQQEQFLMREYKSYFQRVTGLRAYFRRNRRDPPDFWLHIEGRRFAVEVTNIIHEEDRAITQGQWRLVREIESEARRGGLLTGKYVVGFRGPLARGRQRSLCKGQVLSFIGQTASSIVTPPADITIEGRSICDIWKCAGAGANIYPVGGGIERRGGFEGHIREQLRPLLQRAISTKARKMAAHRPAVLVMYDLFWLADESIFSDCVRAVPETRFFEEIYVVRDKGCGFSVPIH